MKQLTKSERQKAYTQSLQLLAKLSVLREIVGEDEGLTLAYKHVQFFRDEIYNQISK